MSRRHIWTVPAEGGTDGVVTEADAVPVTQDEYIDYSPVWSPDGSWLYFASTRGGSMAIWRVAIDEMSGETLGEPQQITSGGVGDPGMLSFSAALPASQEINLPCLLGGGAAPTTRKLMLGSSSTAVRISSPIWPSTTERVRCESISATSPTRRHPRSARGATARSFRSTIAPG